MFIFLFSANDKLEKTTLTSEGVPIVTSNKKSFTYSPDIGSWYVLRTYVYSFDIFNVNCQISFSRLNLTTIIFPGYGF